MDLKKIIESGDTRNPYTREQLPVDEIKSRLDILSKLTNTYYKQDTLFKRVLDNPIFSLEQYFFQRINILFSKFPYPIDPLIIKDATDKEIDYMISKLFETSANVLLKIDGNTIFELKRLSSTNKKLVFVDTLIKSNSNEENNLLLYTAFVSFLKRKRNILDRDDMFELMIA
jgi:hypothetical protein